MSADVEERKLVAIMFTDMVGYSALSQRNGKLAMELLEEHRSVLREIFPQFNGTEIKTIGDAFLIEFNSALEAAQCAIEIQRALAHRNHDVGAERRIEVKIGIHIGDVVRRGGDVYGDGVNIASRIEPLAGAGGICVSMDVERQIRNALETRFEKLAPIELKNISIPMDLFRIVLPWEKQPALATPSQTTPKARSNRGLIAALVTVVATGAGGFYIFSHRPGPKAPPSATAPASVAIPEKSIAVLPFENLSPDPNNAYFATGIQDEILTRLAKIGALKVISHTSTQHYDARPANLPEIARQLGVANILEGSVQRAADQAHINVQLIRAATDEHLWAESYDRKLENIFGVEAEVATSVAEALRAKLTGAEQHAIEEKPTNNLEAYDAYLRGIALWREDVWLVRFKAIQPLEEAVRLDPNFAMAWAMLARVNSQSYSERATADRAAAARAALDNALRLKPGLPEVQVAQGFYQYWVLRDYGGAQRTFESLREVLPNQLNALEGLGMINRELARSDQARLFYDQAIKLNPRDRLLRLGAAAVRTQNRDFQGALQCLDEALKIWPDSQNFIETKAGVYQFLGKLDEADALLKNVHSTKENLANSICDQAILRRQPARAIPSLQNWLDQSEESSPLSRSDSLQILGDLQRLSGNLVAATSTYSKIRDTLEQALKEEPANADYIYYQLARAYAGLGDSQRAAMFIDKAINGTKSPNDRFGYEDTRARIAARFGQADVAIPILERLLHTSYSDPITPAILRLHPDFDLLRGDPRFEKLAHSDGN